MPAGRQGSANWPSVCFYQSQLGHKSIDTDRLVFGNRRFGQSPLPPGLPLGPVSTLNQAGPVFLPHPCVRTANNRNTVGKIFAQQEVQKASSAMRKPYRKPSWAEARLREFRRSDDEVTLFTCWRCGLRGPHGSSNECITALREWIAILEFRDSSRVKRSAAPTRPALDHSAVPGECA